MSLPSIYLDNNAATMVDPYVARAIVRHMEASWGNPSSTHLFGRRARAELCRSRETIAALLGVRDREILFSSGGTESLNFCLHGFLAGKKRGHIITSNVEHPALYEAIRGYEKRGFSVTYLPVGLWGAVQKDQLQGAIQSDSCLIALTAANNETGVLTDLLAIGQIADHHGIPLLVDGVSWLGKAALTIPQGVAAICFSGQKIHAPQGVGFAYLRAGWRLPPLLVGGEQERGLRGGTENMPGIVGLAEAANQLQRALPESIARMCGLRNQLEEALLDLGNVKVNGEGPRTANTSNLCFQGVDGERLLSLLDMEGIAVSHGAACSSGLLQPSRVLQQMGLSIEEVRSSIRFSLSRFTTEAEIERTVSVVKKILRSLGS